MGVPGIRIIGSEVKDVEVRLGSSFIPCPTAQAVGIPLVVKREASPGDESGMYAAVRFMTDPRTGLAPMDWQYGGLNGPAPPVLVARADGLAFSSRGYAALDDFISATFDEGPCSVTRAHLCRFLRERQKLPDISEALGVRFPKDLVVKSQGLTAAAELNGMFGVVTGRYENGRVGISFPEPHGIKALKPENLLLESGAPADQAGGDKEMGDEGFYESTWLSFDGLAQPDDVPSGTKQFCYWMDGIEIHRKKLENGSWEYWDEDQEDGD